MEETEPSKETENKLIGDVEKLQEPDVTESKISRSENCNISLSEMKIES